MIIKSQRHKELAMKIATSRPQGPGFNAWVIQCWQVINEHECKREVRHGQEDSNNGK